MAIQQAPNQTDVPTQLVCRWPTRLPVLTDGDVTLRELRVTDALVLLSEINKPVVLRYLDPSPQSIEGFKRFIRWTHAQRRRGLHLCFGVVPAGQSQPLGIIQLWPIERDFSTAEWGFVMCESAWGTGIFVAAARLVLDLAFDTLGVSRLEARAVNANGRGNGVLRKLGATPEGTLRSSFRSGDVLMDQTMWSILADER